VKDAITSEEKTEAKEKLEKIEKKDE